MGLKPRAVPTYPYPFVGHGVGYARKCIECFVAFHEPVPVAMREAVETSCPAPLAVHLSWTARGLVFASDDGIFERVIDTYPGEPLEGIPAGEQWDALARDVDRWLLEIGDRHPVACVVWPLDSELGHKTDAWHDWSLRHVPAMVRDHLSDQGDDVAWFADRATDALEQSQRDDPPERRESTLDELVEAWRAASGAGSRPLDLRFAEQWSVASAVRADLRDLWHAATRANRFALAGEVCSALLGQAQPPRYVQQWLVHRVDTFLLLGDLEAARDALPPALLYADFYDNAALLALLRYCVASGDGEQAAVVYHAGAELGSYFKLEARSLPGFAEPARPAKVMLRFAAAYRAWVAPAWRPQALSWNQLVAAKLNFEEVHKRALRDDIATADAAIATFRGHADGVRRAAAAGPAAAKRALEGLARPIDQRWSEVLGELAVETAPTDPDTAEPLFRAACSFWQPPNATLVAYCDFCVTADRSMPDELACNLITLARISSYGGCALLAAALRYHRARKRTADADAVERLRDTLECPPAP